MTFEVYRLPTCGCGCDAEWNLLGVIDVPTQADAWSEAAYQFKCDPDSLYVVPVPREHVRQNEEQASKTHSPSP